MTYQKFFPDFDRADEIDLLVTAGWKDESWRNDHMPRVHCGDACIWIEWADANRREFPELSSGGYVVEFTVDGMFSTNEVVTGFSTLKQALGFIYERWIGYEPFDDDPEINPAEVAETLAGYVEAAADAAA